MGQAVTKRTTQWSVAAGRAAVLALGLVCAAAAGAADMNKVLRIALNAGETGFDPIRVTDTYSNGITEQIYEPLLTYDYLARPARLVPLTAAATPSPVS